MTSYPADLCLALLHLPPNLTQRQFQWIIPSRLMSRPLAPSTKPNPAPIPMDHTQQTYVSPSCTFHQTKPSANSNGSYPADLCLALLHLPPNQTQRQFQWIIPSRLMSCPFASSTKPNPVPIPMDHTQQTYVSPSCTFHQTQRQFQWIIPSRLMSCPLAPSTKPNPAPIPMDHTQQTYVSPSCTFHQTQRQFQWIIPSRLMSRPLAPSTKPNPAPIPMDHTQQTYVWPSCTFHQTKPSANSNGSYPADLCLALLLLPPNQTQRQFQWIIPSRLMSRPLAPSTKPNPAPIPIDHTQQTYVSPSYTFHQTKPGANSNGSYPADLCLALLLLPPNQTQRQFQWIIPSRLMSRPLAPSTKPSANSNGSYPADLCLALLLLPPNQTQRQFQWIIPSRLMSRPLAPSTKPSANSNGSYPADLCLALLLLPPNQTQRQFQWIIPSRLMSRPLAPSTKPNPAPIPMDHTQQTYVSPSCSFHQTKPSANSNGSYPADLCFALLLLPPNQTQRQFQWIIPSRLMFRPLAPST